jgi:hypothetical protein
MKSTEDTQHLIEFTRAAGCRDTLRYEHRRASAEQLLAIPDAIAWCWANGGDWRRRPADDPARTVEPAPSYLQRASSRVTCRGRTSGWRSTIGLPVPAGSVRCSTIVRDVPRGSSRSTV